MTNPLDDLLNFAHRSYVRLEAEQLILECLELEDVSPFNDLLEKMVLAGGTSLYLLREVLEEVLSTKSQLNQEELGVRQDLMDTLTEFGVSVPELLYADGPEALRRIFDRTLQEQIRINSHLLRAGDEVLLEEICADASDRVMKIARRVALLKMLEEAVRDWMGSLAYEVIRSRDTDDGFPDQTVLH